MDFLCFPYKTQIVAVYVLSKNEKIIYTSVNPSLTIYKMGFKGYKFHGRITVILFGCGFLKY